MLAKGIAPASDVLGVFPSLLRELTARRLGAKRAMRKEQGPVEQSRLDAEQGSLKILINSFYGYLGYSRGLFNDFAAADVVTGTGQDLLRQMIGWIQQDGGTVIEADTDGIFFVPPESVAGEEAETAYVATLSARMPQGITVAYAGRFRRMLSYKKKNYALLSYDNRITIRGSALVSRSMEPFGRSFLQACIDHLLNGNIAGLHNVYATFRRSIMEHTLQVSDFARVETLRDPPEVYRRQVAAGKRNKSAAYELALSGARPVRPGDRIAYYITGSDPNVRGFENCKIADDWDPNFPDENTPFYLRRLDEFCQKFADFFHPRDFRALFSADELFPFDPAGIIPLIAPVAADSQERPEEKPGLGIWLDE
jgi:DNA polymerase elongation subunit (family B)